MQFHNKQPISDQRYQVNTLRAAATLQFPTSKKNSFCRNYMRKYNTYLLLKPVRDVQIEASKIAQKQHLLQKTCSREKLATFSQECHIAEKLRYSRSNGISLLRDISILLGIIIYTFSSLFSSLFTFLSSFYIYCSRGHQALDVHAVADFS